MIIFKRLEYLFGVDKNINNFLNMKKKEVLSKPTKSKIFEHSTKKSATKIKHKPKEVKKQDSSLFVLVGDSFYLASTKTERRNYEQFQQKVKVASSSLKKCRTKAPNHFSEGINLQEYVKTLSKEEKANLLRDLEKQVGSQRMEESQAKIEKEEDKMGRLVEKLQGIKGELIATWDDQMSKINNCFDNQQIGLQEKNQKIHLIQKIKKNKIAMINHTKMLFEKILKEQPDIELEKSERMDYIINSLNSISSLDPREAINHIQFDSRQFVSSLQTPSFNIPSEHKQDYEQSNEYSQEHVQLVISINHSPNSEKGDSDAIKIEQSEKSQTFIMSKQNLKLDIRLDEVEFGKDHYDDEIICSKPAAPQVHYNGQPENKQTEVLKLQLTGQKRDDSINPKLNISESPLQDDFMCVGQESQIKIPILMTKDRLEQIQLEKSAKQIENLTFYMKARQAIQIGQLVTDNKDHFTSLTDVNQFIVRFYEFIMRNFMREVLEGMNIPYGRSCIDKLDIIHKHNKQEENLLTNVLTEEILNRFHRDFTLSVRILKQEEKIHNRALFHAFNLGLNVYRPYFELQGQVFPWNTSEKGLTFYQISQDNIEEVFEKSKMKVLEYCSSLCGLSPDCQITTPDAKRLLFKKNEDCYERVMKAQMTEHFNYWNIQKVNYEAYQRLELDRQIYEMEIENFCVELLHM